MGRQTYIKLPNQLRRKRYQDPSARQAGALKASKVLSGQRGGRERRGQWEGRVVQKLRIPILDSAKGPGLQT